MLTRALTRMLTRVLTRLLHGALSVLLPDLLPGVLLNGVLLLDWTGRGVVSSGRTLRRVRAGRWTPLLV